MKKLHRTDKIISDKSGGCFRCPQFRKITNFEEERDCEPNFVEYYVWQCAKCLNQGYQVTPIESTEIKKDDWVRIEDIPIPDRCPLPNADSKDETTEVAE